MAAYSLARPIIKDGFVCIPITDAILSVLQDNTGCLIETRFDLIPKAIKPENIRYYYGILIPHIIRVYRELNGIRLSEGEVDLLNRREANNGHFKTATVNNKAAIIFSDISLKEMNTIQYRDFIENVYAYWNMKGIEPPTQLYHVLS